MHGMKHWSAGLAIGIIGAFAFPVAPSVAEPWPQRTVRIIVPIGAGGGPDVVARLFSARLAERWNHPVIVENRPGADGLIGTAAFVTAHDDHTLLYMTSAPIAVYPVTRDKLPMILAATWCRSLRRHPASSRCPHPRLRRSTRSANL
jgi:tripartite-type tricarboxylate transporter receptor subunit TctC